MASITHELLIKQNAETSNGLIEHYKENAKFQKLAKFEGDLTVRRDQEDDDKLQVGIEFAKKKKVIDPDFVPEPYVKLDVIGKTPDTVANEILTMVTSEKKEEQQEEGSIIVLCGLSGTGKGTTVSKLRSNMEESGKKVVTWSNGNIFRSVTYLAATWCEQNGEGSNDIEKALTKENLQSFMSMLKFGKFNEKYDTRIFGLGVDMLVSEVQNTELKSAKVSKNIPTVAEQTQGEVILFAANAVDILKSDGQYVLLEGREQTVNYVRTPHRFTLILSDESLIGKRRAAQRLMAAAAKGLAGEGESDEKVVQALDQSLDKMVNDIE